MPSFVRAKLALRLEKVISARAKANQIRKPNSVLTDLTEQKINTREELAKAAGVSQGAIHKTKVILERATDEQKGAGMYEIRAHSNNRKVS